MSGTGNATNKAALLNPSVPIPRVEINRIGPEWLQTAQRAEAFDSGLHVGTDPRDVPEMYEIVPPGGSPAPRPVPPAPPSESELRAKLAETLVVKQAADDAVATAVAAHERAAQLIAERQRTVASFANLDQRIAAFTVEKLRGSGKADLPADMIAQRTARELARCDLGAAEAASSVLASELADARAAAEQAARIATNVALAILNTAIMGTVERHKRALQDVEASYVELATYDRFISAVGTLPFVVGATLRNPPADHRGLIASPILDPTPWRDALAALLADPAAVIMAESAQ